jgi:NADH-quinone oxidoreductase subunit G
MSLRMLTIFIDNKPYQVKDGQNLLQACLSLGFDLPYFCWHPAMHSVGACRQCAVKLFKDEKDTRGRIVMSCMTPVSEGMRLSVNDLEARTFRSSVIEWLMLNHPHDCPVCDEGGECHLQDMTVMTGHVYRRTRFKKRTHRNQNLGPFINHEMNRCIQCYRCVRFYRDYAGGRDFDVFACHDHVYFGRHEDGVLENEFSGNLVEICPTGVFTDKSLKRHFTRKWDLQTAPSVCVHCGVGCNIIPGERYGTLRRILNRYNRDVNGYFLCDRGRYGYEFVNSSNRMRRPLITEEGKQRLQPTNKEASMNKIRGILAKGKRVIGIGSPRASLESNYALRSFVGHDNFYSGMSSQDQELISLVIDILQKGPARTPSLQNIEMADAVLVLGEDVTNTAPILALALRQSARRKAYRLAEKMKIPFWDDHAVRNAGQDVKTPLYIASYGSSKLDDLAVKTYRAAPDNIARLGFAVAHELNTDSTPVPALTNDLQSLAKMIAESLQNAERPLIVSGTGCRSVTVIQAAAAVSRALCATGKNASLCYAVHECNDMGLGLMGGKSLHEAFKAAQDGYVDAAVVLENDLYRRAEDNTVNEFLRQVKHVIAIDHLLTPTSSKAAIALPAGTFAESHGTLVNSEGRAQRFYQVMSPDLYIQESWKWIRDIMAASGHQKAGIWRNLDDITNDMTSSLPIFKPVQDIAPHAYYRVAGMMIPRQPHRYSGRTAMHANVTVHESRPPQDPDCPLAFSMEGYDGQPPAPLILRYWSPGWNSVQSLNKFQQEVGGHLRGGDPGKRLIEPAVLPSSLPTRQGTEPSLSRKRHSGASETSGPLISFPRNVPEAFEPKENEWLIVPLYNIFGSDELSLLAPGIAERAPKPYICLNPEDAKRLDLRDGDVVELSLSAIKHELLMHVSPGLPNGVAGLGASLSSALGHISLMFGTIRKK